MISSEQIRMRLYLIAVVAGGLATGACTEGRHSANPFTTVDSAGIVLAHSDMPRWGKWLVSERKLEFGEATGPDHLLFDRISGITRLGDGSLAVGNRGTSTIRIFTDSGDLLGEFGGRGEGPGEFTLLRGVSRCRSGIITAFDYNYRQVQFDHQGAVLGSAVIRFPDERLGIYELACDNQGRVFGTGWGDAGLLTHPVGNYRARGGLYGGEGAVGPFTRLGTTYVADRVRIPDGEHPHPFGRTTVLAAFEDGFAMGTADTYAFAVHSTAGDTTMIVRWRGPSRALEDHHVAQYLDWRLAGADAAEHARIRREVTEIEMPDSLPAYGVIHADPDGVIWIGEFGSAWHPRSRWWGFLPSGEWAWEVELEPGFSVSEFGTDEVLGVARGEYGVEAVRGYRLDLPRDSS